MAKEASVIGLIAELDLNIRESQVLQDWGKVKAKIGESFSETLSEAVKSGLKVDDGAFKPLAAKWHKLNDEINDSTANAWKLQSKIELAAKRNENTEEMKALLVREQLRLKGLETRAKRELVSTNAMVERRKKGLVEAERLAGRTRGEVAEEFGEGIKDAFEDLKGGNFSGLLKKIGGGAEARGLNMQAKAAEGGMGSKTLGSLGGFLAKLGPMLLALGAIAGGFAAIAKVIIDADAQAKELNRTLLDGGIAGADLADKFGDVTENLEAMREVSTDINFGLKATSFNRIWGTTAKDQIEIAKAFDEGGVSIRKYGSELSSAKEKMVKVQGLATGAMAYSKLLGMSANETATAMSSYMEELGLTIQGVQERFSSIVSAAKESGFATKRFFNMILQATSGMSMYNVRLEEAAGLLINLGKILGQKMGGDFLQNLTKGFKDEGTLDRVKKTMTTGLGKSLSILQKGSIKATEDFLGKLKATSIDTQKAFQKAFSDVGGKGDLLNLNPEELSKQFSKLSSAQKKELSARAQASHDPEMIRMISAVISQSSAFSGGLGGAQAARQHAGPAEALLLQMNELGGVLGKRIDEIDEKDIERRAAWENITGKSGEEFLKLFRVSQDYAGKQDVLAKTQEEIAAKWAAGDLEGAAASAKAFNDAFGKEFGVVLTDSGERLKAFMDKAGNLDLERSQQEAKFIGNTLDDLVMSSGDQLKGSEVNVAEDIALAKDIASNTTDMTKIMEQGVQYFLEKINSNVEYIASILGLGKGLEEPEKKARSEAVDDLQREIAGLRKEQQLKLKGVTSSSEREAIKASFSGRIEEKSAVLQQLSRLKTTDRMTGDTGDKRSWMRMASLRAAEESTGGRTAEFQEQAKKLATARIGPARYRTKSTIRGETAEVMDPEYKAQFEQALQDAFIDLARTPTNLGIPSEFKDFNEGPDASFLPGLFDPEKDILGVSMSAEDERAADLRAKKQSASMEDALREQTSKTIAADNKRDASARIAAIAKALFDTGDMTHSSATEMASRYVGGASMGAYQDKLRTPVRQGDVMMTRRDAVMHALGIDLGKPAAQDFLYHIGQGGEVKFAQRIDSADQVTALASKPGGAVSRAGGGHRGGAQVVHNHFYNDGKGIFASMKKWQQANGQG